MFGSQPANAALEQCYTHTHFHTHTFTVTHIYTRRGSREFVRVCVRVCVRVIVFHPYPITIVKQTHSGITPSFT